MYSTSVGNFLNVTVYNSLLFIFFTSKSHNPALFLKNTKSLNSTISLSEFEIILSGTKNLNKIIANKTNNTKIIKVNTLVVFFDYLFSLMEFIHDKTRGGTLIKNNQYKLITDILTEECTINTSNNFYQLIMGAGKSSYIAPLLSLLLVSIRKYPIHIMPDYLIEQSSDNMKILNRFGIQTTVIKSERGNTFNFETLDILNISNTNIIMSDTTLKSILLNNITAYDNIRSLMINMSNFYLIFDEVDIMSDPYKSELNYPIEKSKSKPVLLNERIDIMINIFKNIYFIQFRTNSNKSYERYSFSNFNNYYIEGDFDNVKKIYIYENIINNVVESCKLLGLYDMMIEKNITIDIEFITNESRFKEQMTMVDKQYIEKINILYYILFDIIPYAITHKNRKDFGLYRTDKALEDNKRDYIAIPFTALETPLKDSEFSDINMLLALTIISYMSNIYILRIGDYDKILLELRNRFHNIGKEYWKYSSEYQEYRDVIIAITKQQLDLDINEYYTFDKILNKTKSHHAIVSRVVQITSQLNLLRKYMYSICVKYIFEYKYQYSSTFTDIVSSDFCNNRTGFTGTPYFISPYDRINKKQLSRYPIKDNDAEGSIFYTIFDTKNEVIPNINIIQDIFNLLSGNNYNALIDVGSYFIGYTNEDIAKQLIDRCGYSKVIYLDKYNNKMVMTNKEIISILDYTYDNDEKMIVYFDQKHTTGIDIKIIPYDARGLLTIGYDTGLRNYGQGAFRLRKINITQHIDICISDLIFDKIKNSDIRFGLFSYLLNIEETRKQSNTTQQNIHNLKTLYRNEMITNGTIREFLSDKEHLRINCYINKTSVEYTQIGLHDIDNDIDDINSMVKYLKLKGYLNDTINTVYQNINKEYHMKTHVIESKEIDISQLVKQETELTQQIRLALKLYGDINLDDIEYSYNDIFIESNYGSNTNSSKFISTPYTNKIYMSKKFIKEHILTMTNLYSNRMIKTTNGKILLITLDEYEKIYTKYIEKNDTVNIDMDYDLHLDIGIRSLSKYIVFLEIRNIVDCCYMIDNFIIDFKSFIDDILITVDKSKISNSFIYNIIVCKKRVSINFTEKKQLSDILNLINIKLNHKQEENIPEYINEFVSLLMFNISLVDVINDNISETLNVNSFIRLKIYGSIFGELYRELYGQIGGNKYREKYLMYKKKYLELKSNIK